MHFGHFGSVDRFEPAKCIFCYRCPIAPKLWTDSNRHTPFDAFPKSFPLKIYLQSHRCNGILDIFELPHSVLCREQGQSEKDAFSVWIDSNYLISLKPLQTVITKLLFSYHGQIRTTENQILTYRRQRISHGSL